MIAGIEFRGERHMRNGWLLALATAFGSTAAAAPPAPALVLVGDGMIVGGKPAKFGAMSKAQAIALVTGALGKPVEQGSHGDCGQDKVLTFARFKGDFALTFATGKLVGWTADGTSPKTSKGIAVGAPLSALRKAYPDIETDPGDEANGGLGASFQRENGPDGWLDGTGPKAKVVGLFAGATCIVG